MDHFAFSILFPFLYLETLEEKFRLSSTRQAFFFSSHFGFMFWMIAASRSFFAAFRSKSNEPKSWSWVVQQNLLGLCSWTSFSRGWEILRLLWTHTSWFLKTAIISKDPCFGWWSFWTQSAATHHHLKYGLLGFFSLLLCGLSKSITYLAMHTKAPSHSTIHTDMHACRGDLYTQLFLICTWLLLWLNFEKKGHVIRNFHSFKHKRVQLVSEGSRFYSDVFRKSVNGRNIVGMWKHYPFLWKGILFQFWRKRFSFSVERIFVQFGFFG
jgi:hypothetical protein